MKNFTQNGVLFNKYRESSDGQAIGVAPILVSGQEGVDSEFGGIINAVDIDWNAADLQSAVSQASTNTSEDLSITGINTTGDLIKVVAEQQAQIKSLSLLVKALYESIVVTDSGTSQTNYTINNGASYYLGMSNNETFITDSNYTQMFNTDNIISEYTFNVTNENMYLYIIIPSNKHINVMFNDKNQQIILYYYNNGKYESTTPNYVNDYCLLRSVDTLETGNYSISINDSEITPDIQQPGE